jgi:hypothetical protein
MQRGLHWFTPVLAIGFLLVALDRPSIGAFKIRVSFDGGATFGPDITDNGLGDTNGVAGIIVAVPSGGPWVATVESAISQPLLGGSQEAILHLSVVGVSTGAGVLVVEATDTGYTNAAGGPAEFKIHGGGSASGTVSFMGTYDDDGTAAGEFSFPGGAPPDPDHFLSAGPFGPGPYGFGPGAPFNTPGTGTIIDLGAAGSDFSLAARTTITHTGAGTTTSGDHEVVVVNPEPASMLVWGGVFGAAGVAGFLRRRRKAV